MKYTLTIISLAICILVSSQDKTKNASANCIAFWKKGEHKVLHIIHKKESYDMDKLKSRINFSYEAFVTVLDSTTEGYTMQWIFHLPEIVKLANPALADSFPVFEGMKMLYTISEAGAFLELINWKEVRDTYVKMMELSLPKNLDSMGQAAIDQSKALFGSKEMVEASLIKEIQLFHTPYGYKFTTNGTRQNTHLPNPFAEEPIPAVQTFKITELKPQQDYFKLVITQQIDSASTMKMFDGLFKKWNIAGDSTIIEAKKMLASFKIKDYSEYSFIQSTGWLKRLNYKRVAKTGRMNQTDSYVIEMKD